MFWPFYRCPNSISFDCFQLIKIVCPFSGLDDRGLEGQQMSGGLYGHRSNSSASSSPPATSGSGQTGLVVPQPINAAKGGPGHGQGASGNNNSGHIHSHPSNGASGRKYQCKMCPQVGKVSPTHYFFLTGFYQPNHPPLGVLLLKVPTNQIRESPIDVPR